MKHVSFSSLKIWNECPFKFKLQYLDGLKGFTGNEYTAFGTAIHSVCERSLLEKNFDADKHFLVEFESAVNSLESENLNENLISEMKKQGIGIIPFIKPALDEYFDEYEVVATEEALYEDLTEELPEMNCSYKGYIDLVLKPSDGKYHIIDWKTCSWGWDARRRSERMTTYQLTFYKYFFAKKYGIDMENIETHFALLKRTAKNNKVEIFRVTSGDKKVDNAIKLLKRALYNVGKEQFIKNRLSCRNCDFYKTEHCP